MAAQLVSHKVTEQPDRLVIAFTLHGYQMGEPRQPIVNAALTVALPYLRQKGWINEDDTALVVMHVEALEEPQDGRTLVMGWHLPSSGPTGCKHCMRARN